MGQKSSPLTFPTRLPRSPLGLEVLSPYQRSLWCQYLQQWCEAHGFIWRKGDPWVSVQGLWCVSLGLTAKAQLENVRQQKRRFTQRFAGSISFQGPARVTRHQQRQSTQLWSFRVAQMALHQFLQLRELPWLTYSLQNLLQKHWAHQKGLRVWHRMMTRSPRDQLPGWQIQWKGRIGGKERASRWVAQQGALHLGTFRQSLRYQQTSLRTPYGMCTLRVWVRFSDSYGIPTHLPILP